MKLSLGDNFTLISLDLAQSGPLIAFSDKRRVFPTFEWSHMVFFKFESKQYKKSYVGNIYYHYSF